MKKLSILFIDDEEDQIIGWVETLRKMNYIVDYRLTPASGIKKASHCYDIIFIDYRYKDTEEKTGSDVGIEIRKKYPLVPLVLMTAYGKEHIRDFIYVGFDDYFDKHIDGERPSMKTSRLLNCIDTAINNSKKRHKLIFDENELFMVNLRMDAVENALATSQPKQRSHNKIKDKVHEYEKQFYTKAKKIKDGRNLSVFFELKEKGDIAPNALKVKYLLTTYPKKWTLTRTIFKPVVNIIEELDIK